MKLLELDKLKNFSAAEFNKQEIVATDNCKMLLICFEPGQAVEPCVMKRHTMFYIIEGEGKIRECGHEKTVSSGSLVLIEPDLERQITAKTRLVVLAAQYC